MAPAFLRKLREDLKETGLRGSFLVRDLATGDELGLDPELELAAPSLVKVPLALVTLDRMRSAQLDGAARMRVRPAT